MTQPRQTTSGDLIERAAFYAMLEAELARWTDLPISPKTVLAAVWRNVELMPASDKVLGWAYWHPDTGNEWSDSHPRVSGECPDAERLKRMTFGAFKKWQADLRAAEESANVE